MDNEHPTTENRKHKDSLFVDYFSKDRDWKQHFLSLYNALHGTNLQTVPRIHCADLRQSGRLKVQVFKPTNFTG